MTRIVKELKQRRNARRWQHWSEVDPLDDYLRRARFGIAIVAVFFVLLIGFVVVGLVIAR
jgi:hypothetical protein